MLNIDFYTLKAFSDENIDFFIGSRLQKIQQPSRRDFVLTLRNQGETRKLYININPQIYHIAFMSQQNEKKRNIQIPSKPPMFCMLLRKYLDGARVSDICAVDNERIVELYFDVYDELSNQKTLCLAIELMGKHSNVILYEKESSLIIGCAHNVGSEKSRYRELKGGLRYVYPPTGINSIESVTPMYKKLTENDSVNDKIDNYYADIQQTIILKERKQKLIEIVQSKLKKNKNSIQKISMLLKKRSNIEKYKLYGEILTANLYLKADYQKQIELMDYAGNRIVTVELDETKTLSENAQRYYKLYAKAKITKEKSDELLTELNMEKEYLENTLYSIDKALSVEDLADIETELGVVKEEKSKKVSKINIEKREINGFSVYIGKNNKQNDYIVSKLAKDDDYWFHTRLCAGSHVLLKVENIEPDETVLYECCKLAREFSSASQPSKVGVIYTKAKNLKKPPAALLGYVTYKNEKEVLV